MTAGTSRNPTKIKIQTSSWDLFGIKGSTRSSPASCTTNSTSFNDRAAVVTTLAPAHVSPWAIALRKPQPPPMAMLVCLAALHGPFRYFQHSAETGQRMSFEMSHSEESISVGTARCFDLLLINRYLQDVPIYGFVWDEDINPHGLL